MFLTVVHWFPPILCPRANRPRCASLSRSFLKIDGCNLLSSPFTKERPWVNCSHWFIKRAIVSSGQSRQKSDGSDSIFLTSESLFRSQKNEPFAQKTNEQIPNPAFLWVEIGEILKIFTVNSLFLVFRFFKIMNLSLFMKFVIYCKVKQSKSNLKKYFHLFSLNHLLRTIDDLYVH